MQNWASMKDINQKSVDFYSEHGYDELNLLQTYIICLFMLFWVVSFVITFSAKIFYDRLDERK
jgi:hypothetical protein